MKQVGRVGDSPSNKVLRQISKQLDKIIKTASSKVAASETS